MTECNFGVGELITLAKEHEALKPMKQWEFFEVEEITPSGVVRLFCHTDEQIRFVSVETANEFFDTADKSPNIRYEDGTNNTDFPEYVAVDGTEGMGLDEAMKILGLDKFEDFVKNVSDMSNEEYIDAMIKDSEISVTTLNGQHTIMNVHLTNGFIVTVFASEMTDTNYSEETSYDICMDKVKKKLWELEAYFACKSEAMLDNVTSLIEQLDSELN